LRSAQPLAAADPALQPWPGKPASVLFGGWAILCFVVLNYEVSAVHLPPAAQKLWFFTDKSLFTGLILLLVCSLGVWMYRLMQRLPAQ
jgi:hypothetical protein